LQDALIELSDPQYDFLTSTFKHTGFVAGFGSGKSFIGTLKSLTKILDGVPKTAYYLPTYGDIRDIAFDGFPIVAEMLGYQYKLNKTDKEFILLDGKYEIGKTIFRNMSEPESIVGYQVGYALIDETDILKEEIMDKAYKKILGRNRLIMQVNDDELLHEFINNGIPPLGTYFHKEKKELCYINCIDVAGTPEGYKWFYKRFKKRFNSQSDLLVTASTYSNLHNLPDDFIDTLRAQYTEEMFDAYVNGKFVNLTSGTVYKYFNRKEHHSDEQVQDNETIIIGQDFNIGACVSIVYVWRGKALVAVNEFISYDTKAIIANLNSKYPNRSIEIYPDASGDNRKTNAQETDIQMLRNSGFMVYNNASNPSVIDRVNILNNAFEKKTVLVNTNLCPRYTEALEQQAWDSKTGAPEKGNSHPEPSDFNDAGGYPVAYIFPITTPFNRVKMIGM